jgi:predicted AAA+ superfamily ATPase
MKRHYTQLLQEYLEYFPCVVILGPRQSGKTTLLKGLPSDWKIFNVEKRSDYTIISQDPDLFLRINPSHVAIDEAQFLPDLFRALRVAIDSSREKKGRFVITGSSSPDLVKSISESLAGRVGFIEISPFLATEALKLPQSKFFSIISEGKDVVQLLGNLPAASELGHIHDYWFRGGYPEPWIRNNSRFQNVWMENYIQSYLNRDILRLFPNLNKEKYRIFLGILSDLSGTIINYSEVARALGISVPTARGYFEIAHGSFLWRKIPSYEKNAMKRIVKHPKGYVRDSGLLNHLLHVRDSNHILSHPKAGQLWEGVVMEEIIRGFNAIGEECECYYYRTSAGAEVDLVIEGRFGVVPIKIKYGRTVDSRELRSIRDFVAERGCEYGIIINNDENPRLYSENLIGVPFSCI